MAKYIDKDALLNKMQERHEDLARDYNGDSEEYGMGFGDAMQLLEDEPAADLSEDEVGNWIRINDKEVKCSRCSLIRNIATQEGWNFCPSCGVWMLED